MFNFSFAPTMCIYSNWTIIFSSLFQMMTISHLESHSFTSAHDGDFHSINFHPPWWDEFNYLWPLQSNQAGSYHKVRWSLLDWKPLWDRSDRNRRYLTFVWRDRGIYFYCMQGPPARGIHLTPPEHIYLS